MNAKTTHDMSPARCAVCATDKSLGKFEAMYLEFIHDVLSQEKFVIDFALVAE
jgi:hypothetical protein